MIFVETNSTSIYMNLTYEMYFAREKKLDDTVFMMWHVPPTLIIGKYQNIYEEVNLAYAREHDVKLCRRVSGGGTIYSDMGNWMFSFIEPDSAEVLDFRRYTQPIVDALNAIGVPATFNGRNDLVIENRKFSGNAQYKLDGYTVHHGTLMYDLNVDDMILATNPPDYKIQSKGIRSVRDRVVNVSEYMKTPMSREEFKQYLVNAVMKSHNGSVYVPTEEDKCRLDEICRTEFENWDIIFGANPKFSAQKMGHFDGGTLIVNYEIKKGVIADMEFAGDFFETVDSRQICDALKGCPLTYEKLMERLMPYNTAIHNISADDIAKLLAD